MKYPVRTANGDAGEFFAAYKVTKELGWPCRLFDIDIGIDAQIEILTDDRDSTGRFVALQVKATSEEEKNCCYVSERQLNYWVSLEIPVFVALVNLEKERMYLHLVEPGQEYEKTREGRCKIPFNLRADLFSKASAARIVDASERLAMSHINVYLNPVEEAIDWIRQCIQERWNDNPDPRALIFHMESRIELLAFLAQANAASAVSNVGKEVITNLGNELSWALSDLQEAMNAMEVDYANEADISGFLREQYDSRPEDD
ncbi:DUF4365 domain-containing protein [Janthinobacterium sp. DSP2-3-3]|uniref:DUF4365 domain-containing protein n=1 Tax=Janthinobacterium sp. DSP2-3-3 TaxID=2804596 RepID=UPI003CF08A51